jgi:phosphoribosylformylglycinamidine synthase subunit PurL
MTTTEPEMTIEIAKTLGLLPEEFEKIKGYLGRLPNFTELSIYSVMWSEHCSYKNSITYLKKLPRDGARLLVGAGEENAGLVDIGDGLGCAFKIESHNHPSALEPFQGAATGVGGIHRDIFTMGARPIAALNSLRFGTPDTPHMKRLIRGVVSGISHYGNCFGVPTVGGEVYFNPSYQQNILVNAMSAGIVEAGKTISATSEGPGNPVFIVGSATGKDGIHGATFASADLTEDSVEDLPAVQVGDPFQEKLLLEATLEAIETGAIVGMQDMGAAGITCSTSEMSAKGGCGMKIYLDKVPTRQSNMKPWEILLSESQERMLIVAHKGKEQALFDVFEKWDLECELIGEVTEGELLEYYFHGEKVAEVPADSLVLGGGAPIYDREYKEPAYFSLINKFDPSSIPNPKNLRETALALWKSPNLVSRRWVYDQYDSMVRIGTLTTNSPADAAIVRVPGTKKAIALTTDCNSAYVYADPYKGGMIAVAEAARNISCSGGLPVAITNCLNFGNPYNPEVYYQFVHALKGMGEACRKFDTPVTGGNVSFYNHSVQKDKTEPVYPTPTIGMLGILEDASKSMSLNFKNPGDLIVLIGPIKEDFASSEYLRFIHQITHSPAPDFDLDTEFDVQKLTRDLIAKNCILSAHDVSDGGIFANLLESGLAGNRGFKLNFPIGIRQDAFLFGESQSRIVISISENEVPSIMDMATSAGVDLFLLGSVTSGLLQVNGEDWGNIEDWRGVYENTLSEIMEN